MKRLPTLLLPVSALLACPEPMVDLPVDDAPPLMDSEGCTPEKLASGQLLAHRMFVRDAGKPKAESMSFTVNGSDGICVVIQTGVPLTDEIAPASLVASLEQEQLFGPDQFNAHPTLVTRWVDTKGLGPGEQNLSIELRGKPSSVATVIVFGMSGDTSPNFAPVDPTRLVDPAKYMTTVRDELLVGAHPGISQDALQIALAKLPYPAFVIGKSSTAPILQILVPGLSMSSKVEEFVAAARALPEVGVATLNYAAYILPMEAAYPAAGSDPLYLNDNGNFTSIDDTQAWHLSQIKAPGAWSVQKSGAPIGILDVGFNTALPDLVHAQCMEKVGGCEPPKGVYACSEPQGFSCAKAEDCPGPNSAMCDDFEACWGADYVLPDFHGNAVAGLAAAQTDPHGAIGVSMSSVLLVDTLNREGGILQMEPSAAMSHVDLTKIIGPWDRFVTNDPPARILIFSFGNRKFCRGTNKPTVDLDQAEDFLDGTSTILAWWLLAHRDVFIAASAGNEGESKVMSHESGYVQRLVDPGFYKRWPSIDSSIAEQVLTVGAGLRDGVVASYTSFGGSPLVAPVGRAGDEYPPTDAIGVLKWDGTLAQERYDGTSFANPQVAGVASLMLGVNPKLSARHIKQIIQDTADVFATHADKQTYFLLDAEGAVTEAAFWRCSSFISEQGASCPTFWDINGHKFERSIETLACHCVLQGYPEGDFRPEAEINRAEMLKVVVEAVFPADKINSYVGKASSFPDVPVKEWYAKYVALADDYGFITGIDGKFVASKAVNRAEAVTMLARAANALDVKAPEASQIATLAKKYKELEAALNPVSSYPDVDPDAWYFSAAQATASLCIYSGSGKMFEAGKILSRGEAANMTCQTRFTDPNKCSLPGC